MTKDTSNCLSKITHEPSKEVLTDCGKNAVYKWIPRKRIVQQPIKVHSENKIPFIFVLFNYLIQDFSFVFQDLFSKSRIKFTLSSH